VAQLQTRCSENFENERIFVGAALVAIADHEIAHWKLQIEKNVRVLDVSRFLFQVCYRCLAFLRCRYADRLNSLGRHVFNLSVLAADYCKSSKANHQCSVVIEGPDGESNPARVTSIGVRAFSVRQNQDLRRTRRANPEVGRSAAFPPELILRSVCYGPPSASLSASEILNRAGRDFPFSLRLPIRQKVMRNPSMECARKKANRSFPCLD